MKKAILSAFVASTLMLGAGVAMAQSTSAVHPPETTAAGLWNSEMGSSLRSTYTTNKYTTYNDPAMRPVIGTVLPTGVTVYPLPDSMKAPMPGTYSYTVINGQPVVVDSSRKVLHMW